MEKIFKAKRLDNGEWRIFTLGEKVFLGEGEVGSKVGMYWVDKNTICQYTGINDSEGNRIFEGDRVYIAGVGEVIAAMNSESLLAITAGLPNGVTFGGWDYQDVIEDIEKLTGHNIHDKGVN